MIAGGNRAGQYGAGDDGADTRQRERAIDGKPETALRRRVLGRLRLREQSVAQRFDAFTADGRNRQDIAAGKPGPREGARDLSPDGFAPIGCDEIDFGHRDEPATDAEQIDDGKMLAGLRHDAVVGGDDQKRKVDAAGAGQHIVHELLVARHIDKAEHLAVRRRQISKAEIDGNAASFFFLEAIGVDAGERAHQAVLP